MYEKFILEIEINTSYGWIKTFYQFDLEELEIFESWACGLNSLILDSGLEINKTNFTYSIIKSTDETYDAATNFLETFGRPFDLLEQIDGLDGICFDSNELDDLDNRSDDSELYNDTETINNIISAHIEGNETKVKELLENTNILDDDIITNIKNKYI